MIYDHKTKSLQSDYPILDKMQNSCSKKLNMQVHVRYTMLAIVCGVKMLLDICCYSVLYWHVNGNNIKYSGYMKKAPNVCKNIFLPLFYTPLPSLFYR